MPRIPTPAPAAPTWSIADIERETGLAKDTLRVWERRYGFPNPDRDAFGERCYDQAQLERLRLIKRLLDHGQRPRHVVGQSLRRLQALAAEIAEEAPKDTAHRGHPVMPAAPAPPDRQWLQWLRDNRVDTLRQALRQALLREGLATTIETLLAPLSVQVGEAWLDGSLLVYQEHLYTETLQSLLRESIATLEQTRPTPASPPRVVLATLPKERHGIGLLMAECFLTLEGCDCRALGLGTPITELVKAVDALDADVVALSFSAHAATHDVVHDLRQLRDQLPAAIEIWVGGSAPVLHSRRRPPGIIALRQARDLAGQVSRWRSRHASDGARVR